MPVKVDNLKILLQRYTPNIVDTLISSFSFGFRIHFHGAKQSFEANSLWSAVDNPEAVDAKLLKEFEAPISQFLFPLWVWYRKSSSVNFV